MNQPTRIRRVLAVAIVALSAVSASACSPEEHAVWRAVAAQAAAFTSSADIPNPIGDDVLARLRACESNGSYSAVSRSGTYRGAYQFSQRTWDNTARTFKPDHVGVDPAVAGAEIQDLMARALWSLGGSRSWPVCGPRAN